MKQAGMVAHACNTSALEAEARELGTHGYLTFTERPFKIYQSINHSIQIEKKE